MCSTDYVGCFLSTGMLDITDKFGGLGDVLAASNEALCSLLTLLSTLATTLLIFEPEFSVAAAFSKCFSEKEGGAGG